MPPKVGHQPSQSLRSRKPNTVPKHLTTDNPQFLRSIVESPEVQYKLTPERTQIFAEFLHRVGAIKTKAESWKDYFFDDIQEFPGS